MITAGNYKGKATKAQLGETDAGTLQIAVDMALKLNDEPVGTMTTFLFFTDKSAVYSFERLRALGWKGNGPNDIDEKLEGIYDNEVSCTVEPPTAYTDKDGKSKMGTAKLTIDTGAGTVTLNKPLDAGTFRARLNALGGGGSSAPAAAAGGAKPPPF